MAQTRQVKVMDKQGDMGSLEAKTKAELMDLLSRQDKLLSNKKALNRLPDKGEKVRLLADKLKNLIAVWEAMMDDTAGLFERMDIGGSAKASQDTPQATQNPFLKTDSQTVAGNRKPPFKPFRTLMSNTIPEGLEHPPAPPSRGKTPKHEMEGRPPEVSAVSIPPMKHDGTQTISVQEAAELLQKQKSKVEALRAQHAAEQLAERLHIQMGGFIPDAPGRYRNQDDSDDDSSEAEDGEDDEEYVDDVEVIPGAHQDVPNG